jgi:hypothetical protein
MANNVAVALPSLKLSDDEQREVNKLRSRISGFAKKNKLKHEFYEGKNVARDLNISIPPHLKDLIVSVGWAGTVVDVTEERLDLLGWTSIKDDLRGLDDIYTDNELDLEASRAHIEALITGTGIVTVGKGDSDEPEVLITPESSSHSTAVWDYRKRRVSSALSQTLDDTGKVIMETLYLPNENIRFERARNGRLVIVDRDTHKLNRVLVARMRNRSRASDSEGRSEITKPIMYYTDAACRTMLGMEINREFYTAPQRYALGAEPEQFGVTEESSDYDKVLAGWRATMGRFNVIPRNGDDELPILDQFPSQPPTPYIEQLRAYSQFVSSESGIPETYLGFSTDNPPSADSIRQNEYRLVKRAERRQKAFGSAWREIAYLALLVRDEKVDPEWFKTIKVRWEDPSTPTRAATADEATKLVASGILTPDSKVTYDRIGLSDQDQARLAEDKRQLRVTELLQNIRAAGDQARQDPATASAVQPGSAGEGDE